MAASAALAPSGGSSASALGSSLLAAPSAAADGSGDGWGSFGSGSWSGGSGSGSPSGSGIGSGSFGLSPLATPTSMAAGERTLSRFDDSAANGARDSSSGSFAEVSRPLQAPRRGGGANGSGGNPFSL